MVRLILVGIAGGVALAVMDMLVNANPLGRSAYSVFEPLARKTVNAAVGTVIDLAYGVILAGAFLILYESLPGGPGILKGLSFAALAFILRVLMSVISQWMMLRIPARTLFYGLITGAGEMAVLGVLYGLLLKPLE